jgi:hypothetical protein
MSKFIFPNRMQKNNLLLTIFTVSTLLSNTGFSQNYPFTHEKFNVTVGGTVTNSFGLEVKVSLVSTKDVTSRKATLSDQPAVYENKKLFTLFITVTNTGLDSILISDWHFRATCPEDNLARQWNETSTVPLITPYIPSSTNFLFKPGEKKSFNVSETDFYWCLPAHEAALMTEPCGVTANITCAHLSTQNSTSPPRGGKTCMIVNYEINHTPPPLDSQILDLIDAYNNAERTGKTDKTDELKKTILEIAEHAYPDQTEEIKSLLNKSQIKDKPIETANSNLSTTTNDLNNPIKKTQPTVSTNSNISKTSNTVSNVEYSDWLTIKNPYHDMQVRYKLEKQEGDIGYYKTQFRIDFESKSRCLDQRCLGFVVCFGYPTPDEKEFIYLHYKIYNSFKEIYTMPNLIPIKLSFSDGSKRLLKQDGFYYTTKGSSQETYFAYFDKSVDYILSGSPIQCKNFIESKAIILK